jgi:hypothetical protein
MTPRDIAESYLDLGGVNASASCRSNPCLATSKAIRAAIDLFGQRNFALAITEDRIRHVLRRGDIPRPRVFSGRLLWTADDIQQLCQSSGFRRAADGQRRSERVMNASFRARFGERNLALGLGTTEVRQLLEPLRGSEVQS